MKVSLIQSIPCSTGDISFTVWVMEFDTVLCGLSLLEMAISRWWCTGGQDMSSKKVQFGGGECREKSPTCGKSHDGAMNGSTHNKG